MRLLKLSNKKFFYLLIFVILFSNHIHSNEPIDIWELENVKKTDNKVENKTDKVDNKISIDANYINTNLINIEQDEKIESNKLKLVGYMTLMKTI